jgi:hypothetical protein
MVKKAKRKIEFVENNHVESDILEKYLDWSKIKDIVKSIPEKPVLEDFQKLAKFKFQDPTSWKV